MSDDPMAPRERVWSTAPELVPGDCKAEGSVTSTRSRMNWPGAVLELVRRLTAVGRRRYSACVKLNVGAF